MPKRTKKLLVYLDQNFISEVAKADINERIKPEWRQLYELLHEGFVTEKLVVPQSWFHDVETSLAPSLKERIKRYQGYLGQVRLQNSEHVRRFQTARFLQRFLGRDDTDPFEVGIAFYESPDERVKQFSITVNQNLSQFGFSPSASRQQPAWRASEADASRTECDMRNNSRLSLPHSASNFSKRLYISPTSARTLVGTSSRSLRPRFFETFLS
jgi:hypothetical protein